MLLILPSLFGVALLADGLSKVIHGEWTGLIGAAFGLIFLIAVVFAYFFFSSYLN